MTNPSNPYRAVHTLEHKAAAPNPNARPTSHHRGNQTWQVVMNRRNRMADSGDANIFSEIADRLNQRLNED